MHHICKCDVHFRFLIECKCDSVIHKTESVYLLLLHCESCQILNLLHTVSRGTTVQPTEGNIVHIWPEPVLGLTEAELPVGREGMHGVLCLLQIGV